MKDFQEIVEAFVAAVTAQTEAIEKGDSQAANKHGTAYVSAFGELRQRGQAGRDALATLLTHDRAEVRVMAASFLLRHSGQQARAVLEAEAKGKGLAAFGALVQSRRHQKPNLDSSPRGGAMAMP